MQLHNCVSHYEIPVMAKGGEGGRHSYLSVITVDLERMRYVVVVVSCGAGRNAILTQYYDRAAGNAIQRRNTHTHETL